MFNSIRVPARLPLRGVRWNSGAVSDPPPLLTTMKSDLKTAMRSKDKTRLDVLRRLIAEYNNTAKSNRPIISDVQFGSLLEKEMTATKQAIAEFEKAGRQDLREIQDSQLNILGEYKNQIKTISPEQLQEVISKEIARMREAQESINLGSLMKALVKSGGPLEHQAAPGVVSQAIKDHLKQDS